MPRKVTGKSKGTSQLTTKQLRCIELYLNDIKSLNEIAKEVGVSRSVLYKWRTEDDTFIDELNRQHEIMIRENASRSASNFNFLDSVMRKQLSNPNLKPREAADLAKVAYDVMFRRQELLASVELRKQYEERISSLEEALEGTINNDSQEKE